jgi:hypothetical protein
MAVKIELRPMARLAQQPASSLSLKARAVAMPWLTVPSAIPRAEGDSILAQLRIYGPHTAPIIPVTMVRLAVTAGKPPIPRAISIDTAAVADFGAMESRMGSEAVGSKLSIRIRVYRPFIRDRAYPRIIRTRVY